MALILETGNPQDHGALVTDVEVALTAGPDGQAAILTPIGGRGVGFDIALMDRLRPELPFNDDVRFFEPLLDVAGLEEEVVGYIGAGGGVAFVPQPPGRTLASLALASRSWSTGAPVCMASRMSVTPGSTS